jgi:hypothetical protein
MSEIQQEYDKYPDLYGRYGDLTEELHVLPMGPGEGEELSPYDSWLNDMSSREDAQFETIPFNPTLHPEQRMYPPKLEAKDQFPDVPDWVYYAGVNVKLVQSLGLRAFFRLSHQLKKQPVSPDDPSPLVERLVTDQLEGKNTLVVSSHHTFTEMGIVKAMRFCAKKDRPRIDQEGMVMSRLMTRQQYMGKPIVDHFTPMGGIYFTYPISESSERHKVPIKANALGNALFKRVLRADLARGGLELDVALTGKQIIKVKGENGGLDHSEIPGITQTSARMIKGFHNVIAFTQLYSPVTGRQEMDIGQLHDVQELLRTNSPEDIADMLYGGEIASSIERYTGKEVRYRKLSDRLGRQAIEQGFK